MIVVYLGLSFLCIQVAQATLTAPASPTGRAVFPSPSSSADLIQAPDSIQPLQIGDTVPEWFWHLPLQVVNNSAGEETFTLDDYREKLIILDFWATWCTSCVAAMPGIQELSEQFGDDLFILLISSEPASKVERFLRKNPSIKNLQLMSVAQDTLLKRLFPHTSVPHYAWIDRGHELLGITASHQITGENIRKALSGNAGQLVNKITIDPDKPLLIDLPLSHTGCLQYSMLFRGQHRGYSSRNITRTESGVVYGRAATNLQLLTLYRTVAGRLMRSVGESFNTSRLLIESEYPERLAYALGNQKDSKEKWNRDHLYLFDVAVPLSDAGRLDTVILELLNASSGFHGSMEYRDTRCLVLRRSSKKALRQQGSIKSGFGQNTVRHQGVMLSPAAALFRCAAIELPLVDEIGPDSGIQLNIPRTASLIEVRHILSGHGLELIEAERKLAMFVIRDQPVQQR